ncbi:MAG: ABC transporter permease [Chthoniobacterales bacterium]|nr:ABC transporter permease [Chthoniobacterales bacterium]
MTLLSDEIWQRDFGGDANVVGQAIRINGKPATVIGVMPPKFKFPQNDQLWVPLYNEYPVQPRGVPDTNSPFRKNPGAAKAGREPRPGEPGGGGDRAPARKGIPEDERRSPFGACLAAPARIHASADEEDDLRHARRGRDGVADRLRQRNEHAVRARGAARKGAGDSRRARGDTRSAR